MPELRWILLGLGILFFAGLWWWETHRRRQAVDLKARTRSEPVISPVSAPSVMDAATDTDADPIQEENPDPRVARPDGGETRQGQTTADQNEIVSLRLFAPPADPFDGAGLKQALQAEGLEFGEFSIFHKLGPHGERLFSVASLLEPGSFDPAAMESQTFKGLVLFAMRKEAGEAGLAEMRRTAQALAGRLDGRLGSPE